MVSLTPITTEEVMRLRGEDRAEALRVYHIWLDKQRKEDFKKFNIEYLKAIRENKTERFKEYQRQYREKNRDALKLKAKEYYYKRKQKKLNQLNK